jgi:hypothetical protein
MVDESLILALQLDKEGNKPLATAAAYKACLEKAERPLEIYLNLLVLYYDLQDECSRSNYNLTNEEYARVGNRFEELLVEIEERFGFHPEAAFWRYKSRIHYWGEECSLTFCERLLEDGRSLVPVIDQYCEDRGFLATSLFREVCSRSSSRDRLIFDMLFPQLNLQELHLESEVKARRMDRSETFPEERCKIFVECVNTSPPSLDFYVDALALYLALADGTYRCDANYLPEEWDRQRLFNCARMVADKAEKHYPNAVPLLFWKSFLLFQAQQQPIPPEQLQAWTGQNNFLDPVIFLSESENHSQMAQKLYHMCADRSTTRKRYLIHRLANRYVPDAESIARERDASENSQSEQRRLYEVCLQSGRFSIDVCLNLLVLYFHKILSLVTRVHNTCPDEVQESYEAFLVVYKETIECFGEHEEARFWHDYLEYRCFGKNMIEPSSCLSRIHNNIGYRAIFDKLVEQVRNGNTARERQILSYAAYNLRSDSEGARIRDIELKSFLKRGNRFP